MLKILILTFVPKQILLKTQHRTKVKMKFNKFEREKNNLLV